MARPRDPDATAQRPRGAWRDGWTAWSTERVVGGVLLTLVALLAGLALQAWRAEDARRLTARRALGDYAAVAAWRYARSAEEALHDVAQEIAIPLGARPSRNVSSPPGPEVLLPLGESSSRPGVRAAARLAFRVDLVAGGPNAAGTPVIVGGSAPPAVRRWLAARLPTLAALGGADAHRTVIDTVDGVPWAFAYLVRRDDAHAPRTLYGLALAPAGLTRELEAVLRSTELLPPALAGPTPQVGHVAVRVLLPGGHTVFSGGTPHADVVTAVDTLPPEQGALIVVASVDAGLATSRLFGGSATDSTAALLALLAVAAVLAAVALDQLRRGRELARLRAQFVASVSHELRTPLAHVSAFAETLMHGRERSAEERRYFARVVYREARRLTVLVESVLRFSRRGAAPPVALARCALGGELREAVAVFEPMADAAAARIAVDVPNDVYVLAEAAALRQVVLNLLDNAVKYAPRGATARVRAEAREGEVRLIVDDEGPGIPAADRERVFQAFVRLAPTGTSGPQGTGIGLAVVRDLVSAMGGRVWIDDAPDGGTRVVVALAAAPTPASERPAPPVVSLAGHGS